MPGSNTHEAHTAIRATYKDLYSVGNATDAKSTVDPARDPLEAAGPRGGVVG